MCNPVKTRSLSASSASPSFLAAAAAAAAEAAAAVLERLCVLELELRLEPEVQRHRELCGRRPDRVDAVRPEDRDEKPVALPEPDGVAVL